MPDLTGMPALDLAIGLSFVFLLLSLLASTIQEFIAAFFGLRARTLQEGLRNMLAGDKDVVAAFYKHPLIDALYRGKVKREDLGKGGLRRTKGPSYVSPRAFATFVLDAVAPSEGQLNVFKTAEGTLEGLPDAVKSRLQPLLDAAGNDLEEFRKSIEAWYDDSMARVSGWYKRKTQVLLLVIGAAVVIALNANALIVAGRLWSDQTVRAAVVQQAGQAASQPEGDTARARLTNAASDVASVEKIGVPMGWSGDAKPKWGGSGWITTLAGWLLTITAISLGAPFWFDTLGRLSRLRSSGKPETPLPATGSGKPNERVITESRTLAPHLRAGVNDEAEPRAVSGPDLCRDSAGSALRGSILNRESRLRYESGNSAPAPVTWDEERKCCSAWIATA